MTSELWFKYSLSLSHTVAHYQSHEREMQAEVKFLLSCSVLFCSVLFSCVFEHTSVESHVFCCVPTHRGDLKTANTSKLTCS